MYSGSLPPPGARCAAYAPPGPCQHRLSRGCRWDCPGAGGLAATGGAGGTVAAVRTRHTTVMISPPKCRVAPPPRCSMRCVCPPWTLPASAFTGLSMGLPGCRGSSSDRGVGGRRGAVTAEHTTPEFRVFPPQSWRVCQGSGCLPSTKSCRPGGRGGRNTSRAGGVAGGPFSGAHIRLAARLVRPPHGRAERPCRC